MRLLSVGVLLWSAAALAQLAQPGPQTAYNGQNVSSVSLIANPHRDLKPLLPLVAQKAGTPYSEATIEATAQALKQAGGFPQVQISVEPEVAGLRVNFLLEPAYYLGVVEFPGVGKDFAYTRLELVVNLPDEDPYDGSRIPVAETALTEFLHKNGYFQAKVHAESKIDDARQLVNVSFVVEMGKQARISSVKIEGVDNSESAPLLRAVKSMRARLSGGLLKPGKPYAAERISEATKLMKRTLTNRHRLASGVHENPPQYNVETNRVNVSFQVELGPVVVVRTVGARLTVIPFLAARQMKKLIPIYSEGTIDQDLIEEGRRNLTDYLQKKGFYDAVVTTDFEKQPDQILIVYKIDRGKKHKVGGIFFHGNHALSAKELMDQVTVKKSHIWTHGSVGQKLLKQSADNLQALYRDRGYEEVKVKPQILDREPKIEVAFDIEEGRQTMVEDVQVSGNQNLSSGQLTAPKGFELRAGVAFSPRRLAEDRNRISATYLNRGYLNAEVKTIVKQNPADPYRVTVAYAITENQLVRISEVTYLGQRHTRLSLIKKTAKIPPPTPMRRDQLLEAESRLYDLGIFDWSSAGPRKPITDQTEEMALVKVHEAKRNEITYGFGFEVSHRGGNVPTGTVAVPGGPVVGLGNNQIAPSQATFASPLGSIEFTRRNMRGMAETIKASLVLSQLDQRAVATYGQPHFFSLQWSSLTSLSLERTSENPLFSATLGDASFQLERLLNRKNNTRLQVRYDFNKTVLSHLLVPALVLPQDMNVHLSTFSGTLLRDTRDKPLDAHRGSFSTINLGITPTALGSSANFAKLTGQYAFYKQLHSVVFANSVRLGLVKEFANSFVPTSQLYFSGGGSSLRGFPIDEAGPQRIVPFCNVLSQQTGCVNITLPVGGRELFILNSEVRFPLKINKSLGGVVFYDGGNV